MLYILFNSKPLQRYINILNIALFFFVFFCFFSLLGLNPEKKSKKDRLSYNPISNKVGKASQKQH